MKYIDKINWTKLDTETVVVTKTNKGGRNVAFQAHLCNPKDKSIIDLGIYDTDMLIEKANGKSFISHAPEHKLIAECGTLQLGKDGVYMPRIDIISNLMVWRAAFEMPVKQVKTVI